MPDEISGDQLGSGGDLGPDDERGADLVGGGSTDSQRPQARGTHTGVTRSEPSQSQPGQNGDPASQQAGTESGQATAGGSSSVDLDDDGLEEVDKKYPGTNPRDPEPDDAVLRKIWKLRIRRRDMKNAFRVAHGNLRDYLTEQDKQKREVERRKREEEGRQLADMAHGAGLSLDKLRELIAKASQQDQTS